MLAQSAHGTEAFEALAERTLARLRERVQFGEVEFKPGASLGLTVFPDDPADLDGLVAHADRALYAAKAAGDQTWRLFKEGMEAANGGSGRIADELGGALKLGAFDLDYQPIVATSSGKVIGIEALLRWNHARRGRLPASGFIAAVERTPAILPITRFVLRTALRQQRAWRDAGVANLPMCINLAAPCLRWEGLIDAVAGELAESGVAPNHLVLEVTENSFVDLDRVEGS